MQDITHKQRIAELIKSQQTFADKITIIQPAASISLQQSKILMETKFWHFNSDLPNEVKLTQDNDKQRFAALAVALQDVTRRPYLWAVRGGYGSARLYDFLAQMPDLSRFIKNKIIIGYSDITFFHILWNKHGGKSIHAAMLKEIFDTGKSMENFAELNFILNSGHGKIKYNKLILLNINNQKSNKINKHKIIGTTIGGNLTIINNSLGTAWQIDTKNKILFLEDVNCIPHALDRDLIHLKQAGLINKAKAVVFGDFLAKNPKEQAIIDNIVSLFAADQETPIFLWQEFGHGPLNRAIPFGFVAEITQEVAKIGVNKQNMPTSYECTENNHLSKTNSNVNRSYAIQINFDFSPNSD